METQDLIPTGSVTDLAATLRATLETTVRRLGYDPNPKTLELRPLPLTGRWGYGSTVAKPLGRGPAGQQEVAAQIAAALPAHPLVEKTEAVNGFVNFYVSIPAYAARLVDEVLARGADWGRNAPKTEQVMVEFAQPNTHKAVHVGHLRNIVLGDATVRIMRAAGYPVLAATYPGDIGMHVIKCLWCYLTFYEGQEPATGRGRWLGAVYAESDARLEYRKHVLQLITDVRKAGLGPQLLAWLRAQGESDSEAQANLDGLIKAVELSGPDTDPDTPHQPDEELGADIDISGVGAEIILALLNELVVNILPADSDLTEDAVKLLSHADWWPHVPTWRDEVRLLFARWEAKDAALMELWARTRQWSLDEFDEIYRTLGVAFDVAFYESQVEDEGRKMVGSLIERGIAEDLRAEGGPVLVRIDNQLRKHPALNEKYAAQLYKKNKDGTVTEREPWRVLVILRSDGTTLYATKDLALARRKFEDYHVDRSIYVIDVRQGFYFQQVFRVLELYGFPQADKSYHLSYEIVGTKEGAFSSRKGNVPLYEDFEREAFTRARAEIDTVEAENLERRPDAERRQMTAAQKDAVARMIAIGAMKYSMLDVDNNTYIAFDWERALNPRQQSAPYIMYAHARASSVLAKAGAGAAAEDGALDFTRLQLADADIDRLEHLRDLDDRDPEKRRVISLNSELTLLDLIGRFPEEIARAAAQYNPVILTRYLFNLAEAFNKFWDTSPILTAETPALRRSRLLLTAATRQTIANGLALLGIAAPDVM